MNRRIRGAASPPPVEVAARTEQRTISLEELAAEASKLARPGSITEVALTEVLNAGDGMSHDEQVSRAADALIRAYLPQSWAKVLREARKMERVASRPDFARAVREEVERRHRESTGNA